MAESLLIIYKGVDMRFKILNGSCHCKAVTFTVRSRYYLPYQLCYCSICRKTQGGGGFAINLSAEANTLTITGKKYISVYQATEGAERNFCSKCGSALWLYSPMSPELIHPFASAIDSKLPPPTQKTHLMLKYKASWVQPDVRKVDQTFNKYPEESIAEWHERNLS